MSWRIKILIFGFGALYLFLFFCLYNIQVRKGAYYFEKARAQQASGMPQTPRGGIFFTDKNNISIPAALDKDFPMIYAAPTQIQKNKEFTSSSVSEISSITGILIDDLNKKLNKK